ncbi:MAG TPA: C45 family peptidase [Tepidisphaeraceae bacterium]|nr:C45 family peptidase [Tepidisphaeraceae bacterium]
MIRESAPRQSSAVVITPGAAVGAKTGATTQSVEQTFPVPVVYLSGSPAEMGAGHGKALGGTVRMLHEKYLMVFLAGGSERVMARLAANAFAALSLPEHRDEIAALAAGSAIDGRDTMLAQCFLDLTPMTACSTVTLPAAASNDGVARFGRNLDFPSLGVADKHTTLFIVKPADRYAFASVGWPGMIGVLSGMNEHGLSLANMEVTRSPRMPTGMPYTLLYRAVLEQCKTVDEAIAFLKNTPRQTANNLMLMDATGDRAVAEITPEGVVVRRADDRTALLSTNHQRGADLATPGRCSRYDYLLKQSTRDFGGIGERSVEAMLQHVGGAMTLQSMVFEPANRVIHLSAGTSAADRAFTRIELSPLFR